MGNSLLDFVMALVRDPQAAARYAADPEGALADAHLPGVTIADVQNLIPVVTDSLAMATPDFGTVTDTVNVWTTSAAAAALDAFDIPQPGPAAQSSVPQVSAQPVDPAPVIPDLGPPDAHLQPAPDAFVVDAPLEHLPAAPPAGPEWAAEDGAWPLSHDPQVAEHHPSDHPGFDLF